MNNAPQANLPRAPVVGVGVVVLRTGTAGLEVLLIRRGRPPRQGEWSMPGGKQEWGETLHQTAHREVLEETGVAIADLKLIDVVDGLFRSTEGTIDSHLTLVDYRANWVSDHPCAGDDAAEARWVPISDLAPYKLWSETARVIRAAAAMSD